jgi:hypothetical protein
MAIVYLTLRNEVSELTLILRQPVPRLKPPNVCDVLNLVKYSENPQNAIFLEALADESFSGWQGTT